MLTLATIALQAAKKSHAALERNQLLKLMRVDPLFPCCIYLRSLSVFFCRREAGQRGLAPGCFRALLLRGRRSLVHVALHAGFVLG